MQRMSLLFLVLVATACSHSKSNLQSVPLSPLPDETHFKNLRQMTFGGTNAEAYWSYDSKWLSFQHKGLGLPGEIPPGPECDQIYLMSVDGSPYHRISDGKGRATCSYFFPEDNRILFSSTASSDPRCPPTPDFSKGYVWPIYDTYRIYSTPVDRNDPIPMEPGAPRAYNAEATTCADGSVVFTSDRDGDLELYTAKIDSLGVLIDLKRVTHTVGYDGGAFFSPDCKQIVWRASRPKPGKETEEYQALLKKHLVRPGRLEIWIANADGSHAHQVTDIAAASFAPSFFPDGHRIIFASNPRDRNGRMFDLYAINANGTGIERVSFSETFESFPIFSADGKHLAFSSNRNAKLPHETNVFIADWIDTPSAPLSSEDSLPANRFMAVVEKLSAPEMEGRGAGTQGLSRAEDYVVERFKAAELKPFGEVFPRGGQRVSGFKHHIEMKGLMQSEKTVYTANNILGVMGGSCGKVAPVVVGAHLDHLGYGSMESLESSQTGQISQSGIHPGADDNASGVAAIIEVARTLAMHEKETRKGCYIFAAFTGEEIGDAGSSRVVELFKDLKIKPKAMLNLDMVGRMEDNKLLVYGTESAREWSKLVESTCRDNSLSCPGGGDGYGPSDHMPFYMAGVPVLHFFTGPHADYHRKSDTADKINATGGIQIARVVSVLALTAGSPRQSFHYKKGKASPMMGGAGKTEHSLAAAAYLGTIPDYSKLTSPHGPAGDVSAGGVTLGGTRAGSPAEQAGVQAGDILTSIDDHRIQSLEEFMSVLVQLKPGQKVVLGISRDGKPLKLPATLGKRQ